MRALLHLRQATPALRRGRLLNLEVADKAWVYARAGEAKAPGGLAVVAINTAEAPAALDVAVDALGLADGARLTDRIGSTEAVVQGGRLRLTLPPASSAVFTP